MTFYAGIMSIVGRYEIYLEKKRQNKLKLENIEDKDQVKVSKN